MYCDNTLVSPQNNSLFMIRCHVFLCKLCAIIRNNWTLRSSVLVQKLTFPQLCKKLSKFKDPQVFVAVFTGFRHCSLPAYKKSCILLKIHFNIIILPSISRCSTWSLIFTFSHKAPLYGISLLLHNGVCPVRLVLLHSLALIISG